MRKLLRLGFVFGFFAAFVGTSDSFAAKKQSAINMGTKVRSRTEATNVYDQDCYDAYYGCMDQFCIVDNELGGSCNCNDDIKKYESALEDIKAMLTEAERISTEEVEKVQAGANADIIFQGERKYDNKGNVVATKATKSKDAMKSNMWSAFYEDEDDDSDDEDGLGAIDGKTGKELYEAAHSLCKEQMDDSCSKDMRILTQMYSRQIVSDCKGLANSIEQKKSEAKTALADASRAVRSALRESLEESNKYDRGTCMVEYKKCMRSEDACGSDWNQCVFTIASENMQNNKATSTAGTMADTVTVYNITKSTMEILESKRYICEKVLDSCVAVRDLIWDDFLREAAPTIRLAEQNIESQKRQSCLGDISACIQKACKDDIVGKGTATMDACLARPDMARSFCKVQIDPCERMEPQIWDYVVSKLAAMRVDACTQEVKDCFTAEDRCGKDFSNCIGMDYDYIHDICPIDKLVVCKQSNPDFSMSDLDDMLMGLYLNIDNKELEICENRAEEIMTEQCGSTSDCNVFGSDEFLGTSSVKSQKIGSKYRVTGMISFGNIKLGDMAGTVKDGGKVLKPGELGVKDYIAEVKKRFSKQDDDAPGIISSIEDELNNIAGTINRTISILESDQRLQYCINGRDLSQIKGKRGSKKSAKTEARFPNLLNQYRVKIGMAALRKAQENYNKKVNEAITSGTESASVDVAQYMCQRIAASEMGYSSGTEIKDDTPLAAPYAISYEVGSGLTTEQLTKGVARHKLNLPSDQSGVAKDVTASFDREKRVCHICRSIVTQHCNQSCSGGGLFTSCKKTTSCSNSTKGPECEDVKM